MPKLSKENAKKTRGLLGKIEEAKNIIAEERDKLREYHSDLESILEATEEGVQELERGLDLLSQYL